MKTFMLGALCATLIAGTAFAQTTGPAGQQDTNKPGMANPTTDKTTGMSKDGMSKGTGNSGMTNGAMTRGAESKDGDGMPKGGMSK